MQNLHRTADDLQVALSAMPIAVSWASISDQKIRYMNRKFTELFGYGLEDFADIAQWIKNAYPFEEDQELANARWGAYFLAPDSCEFSVEPMELRVLCKDGSIKTVLHSGVILPETGWALATFVDITKRRVDELRVQAAEASARESQAIHRLLLDHSPEMIILSPFDASRRYISPAVTRTTGFTAEEYLAFKGTDMIHPQDRSLARALLAELRIGNLSQAMRYRTLKKDGGYLWVEATVTGYVDTVTNQTAGYVATIRDISDLKKREDQLASEYQLLSDAASLDELTGIANRRTFNRSLETEARRQSRSTSALALLLLDVDFFKQFNDGYGHMAGDDCLRRIAETLRQSLHREADLVARFGGEEFVVLMPMTDSDGARAVAITILEAVSALAIPHQYSPHGIVTISIGVACWSPGVPVVQVQLLLRADEALYVAKERGRNTFQLIERAEVACQHP